VARVDNLEIEDFSDAPGVQVPENAINLRWDPVADASYYVVQFDPLETFDPDLPPPGEGAPSVCVTPHTVLTPNTESVGLPEQGPALIAEAASTPCEIEKGAYWVRVRAVDRRVDEEPLYSLWSDEARSPDAQPPGAVLLHVRGTSAGTDDRAPAELLEPHNGDIFLDTPVLKWRPVNWADQYKVVIALDRDFTTEVGHFFTTNTRFAPLERIPENAALRSYYWYVVPCRGADGTPLCISSNQVVNRTGAFRSFQKKSPIPRTLSPKKHRRGAWTRFVWKAFTSTVRKGNAKHFRPQDAIGGIDHYEFQTRPKRSLTWPDEVIKTDLPILLPTELPFGARYEWRVRVVDGSGQTRPWSHERLVRTPRAVPNNPVGLQAFRSAGKVRLLWRTPKSRFFPVTGYSIYYSLNGKRWKPLGRVVRTKATFRVGKGTRYWFMVTANNYAGDSPPSRVFVGR
jgi:hypothetical protein